MNSKRIGGVVIGLIGVAMILFSNYIGTQVEEGRGKISRAQKQVDTGNALFSINPVSKEIGKGITSGAQNKINEGRAEVGYYEQMSGWLQIGGIALIVAGIGIIVFFRKK